MVQSQDLRTLEANAMGWDCHATRKGRWLRHDHASLRIYDPILNAVFRQAAKDAERMGGWADPLLEFGTLHLRECADMLQQATGLDPYDIKGWTSSDVQKTNWNFKYLNTRRAAYWSARKFLEACVEHGLVVKFSY
jgi:hypothetical protein